MVLRSTEGRSTEDASPYQYSETIVTPHSWRDCVGQSPHQECHPYSYLNHLFCLRLTQRDCGVCSGDFSFTPDKTALLGRIYVSPGPQWAAIDVEKVYFPWFCV
jgi:hypothetical protein